MKLKRRYIVLFFVMIFFVVIGIGIGINRKNDLLPFSKVLPGMTLEEIEKIEPDLSLHDNGLYYIKKTYEDVVLISTLLFDEEGRLIEYGWVGLKEGASDNKDIGTKGFSDMFAALDKYCSEHYELKEDGDHKTWIAGAYEISFPAKYKYGDFAVIQVNESISDGDVHQ